MAADKGKDDPVDLDVVRKLADLLNETGLGEIEIERGDLRVRVARNGGFEGYPTMAAPAPQAAASASAAASAAASAPALAKGDVVKSPMVGTAYLQPNPGADAFVRPGSQVSAGQTLLIIEAMKVMNQIRAPKSGKVTQILVDNEQPVEFGEPLLVLE